MAVLSFLLLAALVPAALGLPAAGGGGAGTQRNHPRQGGAGFPYGQQKIRGVNIGGWLVLEPWITPSLFEATGNDNIVDEWTFCQLQDRSRAQNALNRHWNSWITESDFAQMASMGLNHVRIPIGYWAYDVQGDEPYISGQAPFLDKAIGWARNHGLKVLIDLHGAPGSQNGFDNSGQRTSSPQWANNNNDVQRTKLVVGRLSRKYSDQQYADVVTALGLLNEPAGFYGDQWMSVIRQYWLDSWGASRYPFLPESDRQSNLLLVTADAFQPLSTWKGFMNGFSNVAMDTHHYQVFSPAQVSQNWDQHLQQTCALASNLDDATTWTMVGEWSLATTDCAKWLNGRGRGSRYEGQWDGSGYVGSCSDKTGSGDNFSDEYKQFLRRFYDTQVQTFERHSEGWIFWCWKNEQAAEWSYKVGVERGWIPRDPGQHVSDVCGSGAASFAAADPPAESEPRPPEPSPEPSTA